VTSTLRPTDQAALDQQSPRDKRSFWRDNALSIASFGAFLVFVIAMTLTGWHQFNADQLAHHGPTVSLGGYLGTGHFFEALFENWESEFLQMGAYVVLTAYLIQRGSAESKKVDEHDDVDDDPRAADLRKNVPWPVRKGGIWLVLYENSLAIAFIVLFLGSMLGHVLGGAAAYNDELVSHGEHAVSTWGYFTSAQFWFESFQNWQSEFLAVFSIVVLSIFLRQRGSSESKPVAAPHHQTGT
jgi:hypothetical protein